MEIEEMINKMDEECNKNDCNSCNLSGEKCDFDKQFESINRLYNKMFGTENKDNVNHPSHYQGANECIDVIRAMFGDNAVRHFCMCNAYKYRFRSYGKNKEEDIKKAEWYETYLINMGKEKI